MKALTGHLVGANNTISVLIQTETLAPFSLFVHVSGFVQIGEQLFIMKYRGENTKRGNFLVATNLGRYYSLGRFYFPYKP